MEPLSPTINVARRRNHRKIHTILNIIGLIKRDNSDDDTLSDCSLIPQTLSLDRLRVRKAIRPNHESLSNKFRKIL